MKRFYNVFIFLICTLVLFQSCDKDNGPLAEKETLIKYVVTTDTPDAQLHIDATGIDGTGLYIKDGFENELYTKAYFAIVDVKCDDPKVAIHVDLWVNKKHKASVDGNRHVFMSERLKGKGPYLE